MASKPWPRLPLPRHRPQLACSRFVRVSCRMLIDVQYLRPAATYYGLRGRWDLAAFSLNPPLPGNAPKLHGTTRLYVVVEFNVPKYPWGVLDFVIRSPLETPEFGTLGDMKSERRVILRF
jgi:hypothetical protein